MLFSKFRESLILNNCSTSKGLLISMFLGHLWMYRTLCSEYWGSTASQLRRAISAGWCWAKWMELSSISQMLCWLVVASLAIHKWSQLWKVLLDIIISTCFSGFLFCLAGWFFVIGVLGLFLYLLTEVFKFKWIHFCVLSNLILCGTKHCLLQFFRLFQPHYLKVLEWLAKFEPMEKTSVLLFFFFPFKKI